MSEKDTKKQLIDADKATLTPVEKKDIEKLTENLKRNSVSSDEFIKSEKFAAETLLKNKEVENIDSQGYAEFKDLTENQLEPLEEKSSIFKKLSEPKLPELSRKNRARLQMQSPNRLYFYWSVKNNPFQTLNQVFGKGAGSYELVVKLLNQTSNREEIILVEAEGSTWFDVDAGSTYQTEIGFYAAHRPFIRLMLSNTVKTPRKNPSPHSDFSSDWTVSANQFAQVLDVSGYVQDAVEVALAGDDAEFAETATRNAFSQIAGEREDDFAESNAGEIRFVLLALASGYSAESLRRHVSKSLFEILMKNNENLTAKKALDVLQQNFMEFAGEILDEEETVPTIFGLSSINFPRFSRRKTLPKFAPISSLNFMM